MKPRLFPFGPYWLDLAQIVAVYPTYNASGKRSTVVHFGQGASLYMEDDQATLAMDQFLASLGNPWMAEAVAPPIEGGEVRLDNPLAQEPVPASPQQ